MTTSTPDSGSRYIHGTEPAEQRRLSVMNTLINRHCVDAANPRPGERVLDFGSGLGHMAAAFAERVGPSGRVTGIERSEEQIALARGFTAANLEFRQGDAMNPPLAGDEWGSFDLVHTRFLLEHVPDPLAIVRQMVRAAKPGGRIVLADDDHEILRIHPEVPSFARLWQAYMDAYLRLGNDPIVGRRLVTLLHRAGARPVRTAWLPFGSCAGDGMFRDYAENMIGVILTGRETMTREGLIGEAEFDAAIGDLREWSALPDAVLWYALSWAEGAAPETGGRVG